MWIWPWEAMKQWRSSVPLPSFFGCPAISPTGTALAGSASRRRPRQQPSSSSSLAGQGGILRRWKEGEPRRAGGEPAIASWLEYMVLSTGAASLFWRCRVLRVLASLSVDWFSAIIAVIGVCSVRWAAGPTALQFEFTPGNMEMSRNSLTLLT